MRETLEELALRGGVPVLGVCVGMQMLARSSDEGRLPGLGWIEGRVRGFKTLMSAGGLPVPHMGWNDVRPVSGSSLFDQLESDARFYFLHSYYMECERAENGRGLRVRYRVLLRGERREHLGVQFHPEKSHQYGTRLLKNFAEM